MADDGKSFGSNVSESGSNGGPLTAASKALHALDESEVFASFLDLSSAHSLLLSAKNFLTVSASTTTHKHKHKQLHTLASESFFCNHPDLAECVNEKFGEVDKLVRVELENLFHMVE